MATKQQETNARKELRTILESVEKPKTDDLIRTDLGPLSFEDGRKEFERTLGLFRALANSPLEAVPHSVFNQINPKIQSAVAEFEKIESFDIKDTQNPVSQRDSIIDAVSQRYNELYPVLAPHLAYLESHETEIQESISRARQAAKEAESSYAGLMIKLGEFEDEASEILSSMRQAAAESGVSQHAFHFKQQAKEHEGQSKFWQKWTVLMAVSSGLLALVVAILYSFGVIEVDTGNAIQAAIGKLVFFSILYYVLVWCARNYRTHQHNYVVNKHRQNALSTFQAFVKAAADPGTKDAVLLRSTEAIFSPGHSGYVGKEHESGSHSQILEILRATVGKDDTQ